MSDRDKALLSKEERERYEQINKFATKMYQMDEMIKYYGKHDANPGMNPWEYIGETWVNWWDNITHTDNLSDVVTDVLDTVGAVATTVVSGVTGILQWMIPGW